MDCCVHFLELVDEIQTSKKEKQLAVNSEERIKTQYQQVLDCVGFCLHTLIVTNYGD